MSNCDKCKVCVRDGLLVLPVRPSLVDLPRHGPHTPKLNASLGGEYASLTWMGSQNIARVLRAGFVHVLYESTNEWDFYEVSPNGYLRRAAHTELKAKTEATPPFVCSRKGANVPASTIGIRNCLNEKKVWIAFAEHLWSVSTLKYYADHANERPKRMSVVDPSAWVNDGTLPKRAQALTSEALVAALPEYAESQDAAKRRYAEVFAESTVPFHADRVSLSQEFAKNARSLEAAHPSGKLKGKTLILLLDDPVGMAESALHLHLMTERAQEAWTAGAAQVDGKGADPQRPWKRQSKLMVDTLEHWAKLNKEQPHRERLNAGLLQPLATYQNYAKMPGGYWKPGTKWIGEPVIDHSTKKPVKLARGAVQTKVAFDHLGRDISATLTDGLSRHNYMGRVFRSATEVERLVAENNKSAVKGRIERYRGHLNYEGKNGLTAFDQNYQAQERAWLLHREHQDQDAVQWLKHPRWRQVMLHDFERPNATLKHVRNDPKKLAEFAKDAKARLVATDKALGAGPKGPASLKYFIEQTRLDAADTEKWIARGVLKPFDALDQLLDASGDPLSQVYDAASGTRALLTEGIPEVRQLISLQSAQLTQNLLNAQSVTLSRMTELVYNPKLVDKLGVKIKPSEIEDLRILWVKAEALVRFNHGAERSYVLRMKTASINVQERLKEFSGIASTPQFIFEVKDKDLDSGTKRTRVTKGVQGRLDQVAAAQAANANKSLVVPVLLHESAWKLDAAKPGPKVELVADGVLGPKAPVRISQELAEELLAMRPNQGWKGISSWETLKKGEGLGGQKLLLFSGLVQGYVMFKSVQKLVEGTASNADLVDASMNVLGGLASWTGVHLEIAAMIKQPAPLAAGAQPGNVLLKQIVSPMRLRMAAGVAGAAGAVFDSVTSFVKSNNRDAVGDKDAGDTYFTAGLMYGGSAVTSAIGSYITYRALAARAGQAALAQLTRTVAMEAGLAAMVGASLTGIGLVLAVAGLVYAIYAISMEDDDNEIFLDRSYFGKQARKADNPPFKSLEDEMGSFSGLSIGVKASLEWSDRMGDDDVTAKVLVARWNDKMRLRYKLWALPEQGNNGLLLIEGVLPGDKDLLLKRNPSNSTSKIEAQTDLGPDAYELSIGAEVREEGTYSRARFEFEFWDDHKAFDKGHPPKAKDFILVSD